MIDIKLLRESPEEIKNKLLTRGYELNISLFQDLDAKRKSLQIDVESLQSTRKDLSSQFGKAKASGDNVNDLKVSVDKVNSELKIKDHDLQMILIEIGRAHV